MSFKSKKKNNLVRLDDIEKNLLKEIKSNKSTKK